MKNPSYKSQIGFIQRSSSSPSASDCWGWSKSADSSPGQNSGPAHQRPSESQSASEWAPNSQEISRESPVSDRHISRDWEQMCDDSDGLCPASEKRKRGFDWLSARLWGHSWGLSATIHPQCTDTILCFHTRRVVILGTSFFHMIKGRYLTKKQALST